MCLSNKSVTKEGYVQKEIKLALDLADEKPEGVIFIIPVKLDDCAVPHHLTKTQWVDLSIEDGYAKLSRSLDHRARSLDFNRKCRRIEANFEDPTAPGLEREWKLAYAQANQIKEFDLRLRRAMPGSSGYVQAKSKTDINRVMKEIESAKEIFAMVEL